MVNFALTTEQRDVRALARDFARKEIRPQAWRHDANASWPTEVIERAWRVGLMNLHVPEAYGGAGLGFLAGALVSEELGWGCSGIATSLMSNGLACAPVLMAGSDELKRRFVAALTETPALASFCLTEPDAGSDVASLRTTATRRGDAYLITGTKCFITNGSHASWYTVFASTDRSAGALGISAFVVPRSTPGLVVERAEDKLGQRASDTALISFTDAEVPAANRLGAEGAGFDLAMATLDRTRPAVAAVAVGIARAAFEFARDYASTRIQFGTPIALHQGIQFLLADMATKIEAARLLTWKSAALLDAGKRAKLASSHAKRFAADTAMEVTTDAVQIYGGHGIMKDHPVEKLLRDAKIMQIYEGTSQIQRLVIAREILSPRRSG
jgi:acyl-CoA dehydrogenase